MKPLGIAIDGQGWHERFEYYAQEFGLHFEIFDIGNSNWTDTVSKYVAILWRPNALSPWLEQAREKIFFMENFMNLRVFPNWKTICTYDNKKAQAYFFGYHNIPTPDTFVSYSLQECEEYILNCNFPIVSKASGGAGSEGVRLLHDLSEAKVELQKKFQRSTINRILDRFGYLPLNQKHLPEKYLLLQQFIPDNARDCRLTVLGKKYVFVLYRRNRPGDFRASGSGLVEYEGKVGENEARYFVELCRKHDFDSMAFDLLFNEKGFVVTEMSYTYPKDFLDNVPSYYIFDDWGACTVASEKIVSQKLQMRYVAEWLLRNEEYSTTHLGEEL